MVCLYWLVSWLFCGDHFFTDYADIDECLSPDTCGPHGICVNSVGSYDCQCIKGYQWNGTQCIGLCLYM